MKEKYSEDNTKNARIKINYQEKKPKVSFSYPIPDKDKPVRGSMLSNIFTFWFIIIFIIYIGYSNIYGLTEEAYGKGEIQEFTECASKYPIQTMYNYTNVRNHLCKEELNENILRNFFNMAIFFLIWFLPPVLIYYPFKKKWDSLYPTWNAFLSSKKIRKFRKEDVIENEQGIYVEIPVFNNVVCDFNAKKDFSKYLREFEIREHKFHYYRRKKTIKINNKKKRIKKYNEFIWYARWYFDKKPQTGEISVIYK